MTMKKVLFITALMVVSVSFELPAQEVVDKVDTLPAAYKIDRRTVVRKTGEMVAGLKEIRGVVAPLGEGDPIKWAQQMPGVTTGADGGSAMYVRGSNAGANLCTVDGIPIYGFSHILGLTTVLPSDVIDEVSLVRSGFTGSETNFTASHLRIKTKTSVEQKIKTTVNINNFLAGAGMEAKLGNKMYFIVNGRVSPLAYEFDAMKSLTRQFSAFKTFDAKVWDVFAKTGYVFNTKNALSATFLYSRDSYVFNMTGSKNNMGWSNMAGSLAFSNTAGKVYTDVDLAYTSFSTLQNMVPISSDFTKKTLNLNSGLQELSLSTDMHYVAARHFDFVWGAKARVAWFKSGSFSEVGTTPILLGSAYFQGNYNWSRYLELKAVVRGNFYRHFSSSYNSFEPEYGAGIKFNITPELNIEFNQDHLVQFYHTLEGLPVGWSLDMIVPSLEFIAPEKVDQSSLTLTFKNSHHVASAGAFYKHMQNLVYNKHAQNLFGEIADDWEVGLDTGKGRSYGAEFLYEYTNHDFYARASYTWSKTNRYGFMSINDGAPFHAKFDRTHVLNATFQWKGINLTFIYQSGNWENAAAQEYMVHTKDGLKTAQFFAGVNNYKMPDIIRLDVGYSMSFRTSRVEHDINLGICNVLNRFNPFMMYYDTYSSGWKMVAMLPILPSLSYRLSF